MLFKAIFQLSREKQKSPEVLGHKKISFSQFCLHHRTLKNSFEQQEEEKKLSQKFFPSREKDKMTTNTKAITECSSCYLIIYCKYSSLLSSFFFVHKKISKSFFGFPGANEKESARGTRGKDIWADVSVKRQMKRKKMFTYFLE